MFGINLGLGILGSYVLLYVFGHVVPRYHIKVNYTRKIYHFFLIFYGLYSHLLIPYAVSPQTDSVWGLASTMSLLIFLKPLRENIPFIRRMFLTIDRPEDRPYTLLWIFTQLAGTFAVVVPMSFLLDSMDVRFLLGIPTFVVGFGDGLAEPVGVRFGRHKYQTIALFSDRVYTRSLEGSACVLIASVVSVLVYQHVFTTPQLIAALLILPPLFTLAEAKSPHTWDAPFLFLVGGLVVFGIVTWL